MRHRQLSWPCSACLPAPSAGGRRRAAAGPGAHPGDRRRLCSRSALPPSPADERHRGHDRRPLPCRWPIRARRPRRARCSRRFSAEPASGRLRGSLHVRLDTGEREHDSARRPGPGRWSDRSPGRVGSSRGQQITPDGDWRCAGCRTARPRPRPVRDPAGAGRPRGPAHARRPAAPSAASDLHHAAGWSSAARPSPWSTRRRAPGAHGGRGRCERWQRGRRRPRRQPRAAADWSAAVIVAGRRLRPRPERRGCRRMSALHGLAALLCCVAAGRLQHCSARLEEIGTHARR